jgi:hypothetical protein
MPNFGNLGGPLRLKSRKAIFVFRLIMLPCENKLSRSRCFTLLYTRRDRSRGVRHRGRSVSHRSEVHSSKSPPLYILVPMSDMFERRTARTFSRSPLLDANNRHQTDN